MIKDTWEVKSTGIGLPVNDIFNKLLKQRGVTEVQEFLNPDTTHIYPSTMLSNINIAVATLNLVLQMPEPRILIYADVDTDGCCSAAILKHYFRKIGIDANTYINEGKDHGIQKYFFESIDLKDYDLLIIVDSINEDIESYEKIWESGCQLIILDHHVPKDEIINNQQSLRLVSSALGYPNPNLSGSGVTWKFINYLDSINGTNYAEDLVDLASVGIIADVCSVGSDSMENRAICNLGFNRITNPGLSMFFGEDTITATDVSFGIAPLINSANRTGNNLLALELLCTDRTMKAKDIIKVLNKSKEEEKKHVEQYHKYLLDQVEHQKDNKCYVFMMPEKTNLAGLLASKLCGQYKRPCIVVADCDTHFGGSIRSYGTDDFSAIVNVSGLAVCSGHENSAGIVIPKDNFNTLCSYLEEKLKDYSFKELITADIKIQRSQITPFLINKLDSINKITGQNFPSVKVLIEDVTNYSVKSLKAGKHLSLECLDMKFLYWNFNHWEDIIEDGKFSAVGTLSQSNFRGRTSIDMVMEDYCFGSTPKLNTLW